MLAIKRTFRGKFPPLPFEKLADAVLGSEFELSLVICGDALSQRMNREHRGKSYVPNVLSFALSKTEGEIFLNPNAAKREAKKYGVAYRRRLALLFVHGCYHLKGFDHGEKMEELEHATLKRFGLISTH